MSTKVRLDVDDGDLTMPASIAGKWSSHSLLDVSQQLTTSQEKEDKMPGGATSLLSLLPARPAMFLHAGCAACPECKIGMYCVYDAGK